MELIHAANNLTIELGPTSWRLFNGQVSPEQPDQPAPLVEVQGSTIRYTPGFGQARRLPTDGALPAQAVARVIVGWAPESQSWHLGLLLAPKPETGGKPRWCGLATWPNAPAASHLVQAKLAGQSLARIIDRPFHLIAAPDSAAVPRTETQPLQRTLPITPGLTPITPAIPVKPPPFTFEDWTLIAAASGLVWKRRTRWKVAAAVRVVLFLVVGGLFLVMGVGTQTRGFAMVEPRWLSPAGLVLGVFMIGLAIYHAWKLATARTIVFDPQARVVRSRRSLISKTEWELPFDTVAYVLVSQTAPRAQGHVRSDQPVQIAQDAWLHLYDGARFYPLGALGRVEGETRLWPAVSQASGRDALQLAAYDTPAHHAAQTIADLLGCRASVDTR